MFLLLHYPSGHWDFVKGHLEPGETEIQAAVRELYEETGIANADFVEGFRRRIRYTYRFGGKNRAKQVVFFLASTDTDRVRLSDEHQDYMWCSYERSLGQVTFRNARRVLDCARRFLDSRKQ
ncbi:MAG: NUDIX domain-containing protein [Nitrosopumilaceae archaeon]|nr:NUDIX domain-containing protein [Nitrosopumilaceae archaeon]